MNHYKTGKTCTTCKKPINDRNVSGYCKSCIPIHPKPHQYPVLTPRRFGIER